MVATIKEKCKRCYNCIRQCPAKAIRVEDGQAKVLEERCIACGSCIKVCHQGAKAVRDGIQTVKKMLGQKLPVLACLAPSFPAAFPHAKPGQVISALRALGFREVLEVAVGADLVARAHRDWVKSHPNRPVISSPCPALILYIRKYFPSLLLHVAPIVSPMVALGRLIKKIYRPDARVAFFGPCIAKKAEVDDPEVASDVDAVLTFVELNQMLLEAGLQLDGFPETFADGPVAYLGMAFPIPGGLLRSASLKADICQNQILVAEGKDACREILQEILSGAVEAKFFDLLFCEGCINGPAFPNELSAFSRKEKVANYIRARHGERMGKGGPLKIPDLKRRVELKRSFRPDDRRLTVPSPEIIRQILRRTNKVSAEDELNCGACGYRSCQEKASAVYWGLAENEMCLPYLVDQLETNLRQLEQSHRELEEAQQQVIQSEKMASVGQLAAGVAHEINNPLGTILLYSHMLLERMEELDANREDLAIIAKEANRCRDIVRGLLDFARQRKLQVHDIDLNQIIHEAIEAVRKQPYFYRVQLIQDLSPDLPRMSGDPVQLKEVFINILSNAGEAMPAGGTVRIDSRFHNHGGGSIQVAIQDTGEGIPRENLDKIFMPFFTTKKVGQGTGLGLAIAYGIIKMHRGKIEVQSILGEGTKFVIQLPLSAPSGESAIRA